MNWESIVSAVRLDLPWPAALAVVVLLPMFVFVALSWQQRRRRARLARYAQASSLARLGASSGSRRGHQLRLTLVALLAAAALTGPRWGVLQSQETRRGIDMAVALDASLSMMAEDERPSRLERMKQEVRRLRAQSRADRIALIAFAGRSYILSPLTADDGALELYLDNLSPDVVGQAGSSIAAAIRQGTELLGASTGTADRALVIMSDGEAFEPVEDVQAAATEAAERGIVLVTVGFGTTDGSTIPERVGRQTRNKLDQEGNVVITKYTAELLAAAAEASGGVFVPAEASDRAGRVRAALASLQTERRAVASREDHVSRFAWFLVPALLLLLFDSWSQQRVRRGSRTARASRRGSGAGLAGGAAAVMLLFLGGCGAPPDPAQWYADGDVAGALRAYQANVEAGDTSVTMRYNLATALLANDSIGAAAALLEGVRASGLDGESEGELRARTLYNAGLAALQAGRLAIDTTGGRPADKEAANTAFAAARTLLREYLGDRYADEDAKWNYELALRPEPPSDGGGGGEDDEQEDQQDESEQSPQGGQLDPAQAAALLNSAARDERDVQGRRQKMTRVPPKRGARDW
jgi:Ca-activated chloride channel family protein